MEIKRERLIVAQQEMDKLLTNYFETTIAPVGIPPLDMDWLAYAKVEDTGHLVIYTARDGDKLHGFVMYVVYSHMHHLDKLFAVCDILAVDPEHRNQGIATALVEYAMAEFKNKGVHYIVHNSRLIYHVVPLFVTLDFEPTETSYMKAL